MYIFMKMTKNQKINLLEFLNRTQLAGKEAVTLVNLLHAVASAEEIDEKGEDGQLTKNV